jgi:hypothetical protein
MADRKTPGRQADLHPCSKKRLHAVHTVLTDWRVSVAVGVLRSTIPKFWRNIPLSVSVDSCIQSPN